ncbi:hypothetical protein T06_5500 [Trichinella sp. T6]|nr:hypothetical protein T06_5500 [Trichinella sp. T6]
MVKKNKLNQSNFTICCIGKFDSISIRDLITCFDRRLQRKRHTTRIYKNFNLFNFIIHGLRQLYSSLFPRFDKL